MRRILLYKTGETDPSLRPRIGCYEAWFGRVLGETARIELHLALTGSGAAPLGPLRAYDGLIVSGSPRSLVEPEPWMDTAAAFVRDAATAGLPVLGVCFGHQLVGAAYGGRVQVNPNGWEVGTVEVSLTDEGRADPLFADLPSTLAVNQSHRDEVVTLGAETRQLATGAQTTHQAIAVGAHIRGVQFHPEMDAGVVKNIIAHRRAILEADAAAHPAVASVAERERTTRDTPDAEAVLRNFLRHFVARA